MRLIDTDNAWGIGILQDWYIHSVNPDDIPQWTDEHIKELCKDFYVIPKETTKYNIDCNLDRLKELAEADKEGRCLVLPCKHNDTVWFIKFAFSVAHSPIEANYVSIRGIDRDGDILYACTTVCNKIERRFMSSDIGKTVFLTKAEAEKALEELKNYEN